MVLLYQHVKLAYTFCCGVQQQLATVNEQVQVCCRQDCYNTTKSVDRSSAIKTKLPSINPQGSCLCYDQRHLNKRCYTYER